MSTTTSQIMIDGPRNFVARFTFVEDGTGVQQTHFKLVDVTTMVPPAGPSLKIMRLEYKVLGGIVQLEWDAPSPRTFAELQLTGTDDYRRFGGQSTLHEPNATGSILVSTLGFDVGSSYDLLFECIKGVGTQFG